MKQEKSKKRVYLDYASGAPLSAKALRAYSRALTLFGNASSAHTEGRAAHDALQEARTTIARSLGTKPDELIFTSGGTEANALAIWGHLYALLRDGKNFSDFHVITTTIEHSSILNSFKRLEFDGVGVTYVAPDKNGIVPAEDILKAVRPNTVLVSMAHVNSELGTVQRIAEIGAELRKLPNPPTFHVDAAQSPLYLDAGPHVLRADMVSYDAQKVLGPKGVGILYRNFSVPLMSLYGGGTQERSVRPGTENVPAVVAAAVAFADAAEERKERAEKVRALRDSLVELLTKEVPEAEVLGSLKHRIANNLFITIPGADGDYLTVLMDREGVAISPRSACIGSGGGYSEVALELTGDKRKAAGTIRFSLGPTTTGAELRHAVKALRKSLAVLKK
jgi:cysteine desulfurase